MITLASIAIAPIGNLIIVAGIIGVAYGFWNFYKISNKKYESNKSEDFTKSISEGLKTFVKSENKLLAMAIGSLALILFFVGKYADWVNDFIFVSFILGALVTGSASYFIKHMVSKTGGSLINESQDSYGKGFKTGFSISTSVGLINVSSVILGIFINLLILSLIFGVDSISERTFDIFIGYVIGVSITAALVRLSSGLFSKSAEKADSEIVKEDSEIDSKSIFNPASNNNMVGRIIGDVGGVGIGIFETFTMAIVAAMLLGSGIVAEQSPKTEMLLYLPLMIASIGILSSIVSSFFIKASDYSSSTLALKFAEGSGALLTLISAFFVVKFLLPSEWSVVKPIHDDITITYFNLGIFWTVLFGLGASVGIKYINESFIDTNKRTAIEVAGQSMKGGSNGMLSNTRMSFISSGAPILLILTVGLASYYFADFYGVAIAAVSFLSNVAIQHSYSIFSAITSNSETIAEKSYLDENTIDNTTLFKRLGDKSKANVRMFLVVAGSLATISMLNAFIQIADINMVNILKPFILASVLLGVLMPILLSSNILGAIKRVKERVIRETKRQYSESSCLKDANAILNKYDGDLTYATEGEREIVYRAKINLDMKKCIKITSEKSFVESLISFGVAIVATLFLSIFGGKEILEAFLVGIGFSSIILASYITTKGNLSESSRRIVEAGFVYKGELVRKESEAYRVATTREKAGKPLMDALAPALITIFKLAIIVALVVIPLLNKNSSTSKTLQINRLSSVEYTVDINNPEKM